MPSLDAITEFRARSAAAIQQARHHDHRRAILVDLLAKGFDISLDELDLEHGTSTSEARGRIDLLYRHLVFEVKRDLDLEEADVLRELEKYLVYIGHDHGVALATDGQRFDAYRLGPGGIDRFASLTIADVDDRAVFDWLDSFLFSQATVVPTPADVVRRFGPDSVVYATARANLDVLWARVKAEPTMQIKRGEWDHLLRIVYGNDQGSDDLFLRHTYLALVARLFAFLALTATCPVPGRELGIVTGDAFERAGIANFVDEDFFSWLTHPEIETEAGSFLALLSRHLDIYAGAAVDEDLLKHLYETLVDPAERHDLGEYYTPDWLAEHLLERAGFSGDTTMLDPACGSGTFLFTAIRMLRKSGLEGQALVEAAQQQLAGFDVHPLAVTVARANFLLALGSDTRGTAVNVPIWMANSLAEAGSGFGKPIEVSVSDTERFVLPTEMDDIRLGLLAEAIESASEYADLSFDDEVALTGMRAWLEREGAGDFFDDYWRPNLELMRRLVREERDTVWHFVLTNAVRPQMIARRPVDMVAGNPPWLAVRSISDRGYQDHVTELALRHHLLAQRRGWETGALELATVFACFAASNYLKPTGRLALVLPRGVLFGAKQHERFRRLAVLPRLEPIEGIDLKGVDPLFRVPGCAVVMERAT